jgi:hypothetical protein
LKRKKVKRELGCEENIMRGSITGDKKELRRF